MSLSKDSHELICSRARIKTQGCFRSGFCSHMARAWVVWKDDASQMLLIASASEEGHLRLLLLQVDTACAVTFDVFRVRQRKHFGFKIPPSWFTPSWFTPWFETKSKPGVLSLILIHLTPQRQPLEPPLAIYFGISFYIFMLLFIGFSLSLSIKDWAQGFACELGKLPYSAFRFFLRSSQYSYNVWLLFSIIFFWFQVLFILS